MLLEKEMAVYAALQKRNKAFNNSLQALALLIASMVLNLPPYYLPLSYYYFIQMCALLAIICVLTALFLSVKSLITLFRNRTFAKGGKYYFAFIINVLILALLSFNIILWIKRLTENP